MSNVGREWISCEWLGRGGLFFWQLHEQIAKKWDKGSKSSISQPFEIAVLDRTHGWGRIAVISVGLTPGLLPELCLPTSNRSRNRKASLSWTGIAPLQSV